MDSIWAQSPPHSRSSVCAVSLKTHGRSKIFLKHIFNKLCKCLLQYVNKQKSEKRHFAGFLSRLFYYLFTPMFEKCNIPDVSVIPRLKWRHLKIAISKTFHNGGEGERRFLFRPFGICNIVISNTCVAISTLNISQHWAKFLDIWNSEAFLYFKYSLCLVCYPPKY